MRDAGDALQRDGVSVAAGIAHVWDLPAPPERAQHALILAGDAAVRVTAMGRGGDVLVDEELPPGNQEVLLPREAERVIVLGLGLVPKEAALERGFGAVSARSAEAVGWQLGSSVIQLGRGVLVAHGATLFIDRPLGTRPAEQAAKETIVTVADMLAGARGVETWLPRSTEVIALVLDLEDPTAAERGDLRIAVEGAVLATPPERVIGPRRRVLFYDVAKRDEAAAHIDVSVASISGQRLAGVMALSGRAKAWARKIAADQRLEAMVAHGPPSPFGSTRVRLVQRQGDRP
jgi:hypothetical protein